MDLTERARRVAELLDDPDRTPKATAGVVVDEGMCTFTEAVPTFDGGTFMQSTTFPAELLECSEDQIVAWMAGDHGDHT